LSVDKFASLDLNSVLTPFVLLNILRALRHDFVVSSKWWHIWCPISGLEMICVRPEFAQEDGFQELEPTFAISILLNTHYFILPTFSAYLTKDKHIAS